MDKLWATLDGVRSKTWDSDDDFLLPVSENVVYTVSLEHTQDLEFLALSLPNARRDQALFASTNFKYLSPKCTSLQFKTGKHVSVGSKTPEAGLYAVHRARNDIRALGCRVGFAGASISNLVLPCHIGYWIDVGKLAAEHPEKAEYNPEKFSGCSYMPYAHGKKDGRKAVVFERGPFNIMGVTTMEEAMDIVRHMRALLSAYRMEPRERSDIVQERESERKRHKAKVSKRKAKRQKQFLDSTLPFTEDEY